MGALVGVPGGPPGAGVDGAGGNVGPVGVTGAGVTLGVGLCDGKLLNTLSHLKRTRSASL